ncbi:hypothetical protein MMC31_005050, partial [Peltigera leucophlebia]|nr:hypothetical protein [Peltigera leucophlebia]
MRIPADDHAVSMIIQALSVDGAVRPAMKTTPNGLSKKTIQSKPGRRTRVPWAFEMSKPIANRTTPYDLSELKAIVKGVTLHGVQPYDARLLKQRP